VLSLVSEVVGLDLLEAAVSSGRGTLLLGPHLGAWEVVGLFVSAHHSMTSLYRPSREPALDRRLVRARERFGARLVPADARGLRALFRVLRRGGVVGILPDQNPGAGAGVLAPLFGIPARTSTLTARLLDASGAVPLLTWAERLDRGRGFRLHFVETDADALRDDDPVRAASALNRELERLIRGSPDQYLWSYRRFRHGPPDAPTPYRSGRRQRAPVA
jgi:KDO2-lipid IV(A) lauroyltransferase